MSDTNYIAGIVKILESPTHKFFNNNIPMTQFRAQLPQFRNTQIVNLTFWGNLANDVENYYKVNDYIIIEGYLSLKDKQKSNLSSQRSKKVWITVLKVYPFLLNYNRSMNRISDY
jgi:Single-strand binding protein family